MRQRVVVLFVVVLVLVVSLCRTRCLVVRCELGCQSCVSWVGVCRATVFDHVEILKSMAAIQRLCCHSCARCPELVKCVHVVGRGVHWSEACLVRRLVFVQLWLESVEE